MSCQKEVVDFSSMSDAEILNYLSTASSKTCGRVNDEQLNRVLTAPRERKNYAYRYGWGVLISTILVSNKASAQIIAPTDTVIALPTAQIKGKVAIRLGGISTERKNVQPIVQITGKISDENGAALPYASVIIKGTKQGVAIDSAGQFKISVKDDLRNVALLVSAVGYSSATVDVEPYLIQTAATKADNPVVIDVSLIRSKTAIMGEVVIATKPARCRSFTTGLVSVVKYDTLYNTSNKFKDVFNVNEIKAYPNPIAPNDVFSLRLKLKESGTYSIKFTDATGKLVGSKIVTVNGAYQIENFNSNMFNAGGIYFASITSIKTQKTYTTRLLLQ